MQMRRAWRERERESSDLGIHAYPSPVPLRLVGRFAIGRRIDHEHFDRLIADYREHVRHVGGKEAAIARLQLHRFSPHFGARPTFQHVADLLDTGMRMRECPLAFLYEAE